MIITTREAGVDVITIDRPAKRNALTVAMWGELATAVEALALDGSVDPIVLRGAGGYFSSGADLTDLTQARTTASAARVFSETVVRTLLCLHRSRRPIIAWVESGAAGGGVELMLACQARFAAGEVRLGFPFGERGVVLDGFTRWRLDSLIGTAEAARLAQGLHWVGSAEATRLGLLDGVAASVAEAAELGAAVLVARVGSAARRPPDPSWPELADGLEHAVRAAAAPMAASLGAR